MERGAFGGHYEKRAVEFTMMNELNVVRLGCTMVEEVIDMKVTAEVEVKGKDVYFSIPRDCAEKMKLREGDTVKIALKEPEPQVAKSEELTWDAILASLPENYDEIVANDSWTEEEIIEAWY